MLTENDRDRATHREGDYVEEVEYGRRNISRGNAFKSADGIALKQYRLTEGPKEFVDEQGRALDEHILAEGERNLCGAVKSDEGGIFILSRVSDDHEHSRLDESRDNGRDRRAFNSHRGKGDKGKSAFVTENEEIVEDEVYKDRNDAADHRELGLALLTESRTVDLRDRKGSKSDEHYVEVVERLAEHKVSNLGEGILRDIELEQRYGEQKEHRDTDDEHCKRKVILCSGGTSYARGIVCARKLSGEDSDTRKTAEDAEVEDKEKLVYGCNRRHFDLSDSSDHNVVNEADGIGEGVLNYNGDENGDNSLIKRAVANEGVFDF